jgi:hypothetical protein
MLHLPAATCCCPRSCCCAQLFATAGSDMVVRVYDDQQRTPLLRLSGGNGKDCCGHSNTVFGLAWKPEDCQVRQQPVKRLVYCICDGVGCFVRVVCVLAVGMHMAVSLHEQCQPTAPICFAVLPRHLAHWQRRHCCCTATANYSQSCKQLCFRQPVL